MSSSVKRALVLLLSSPDPVSAPLRLKLYLRTLLAMTVRTLPFSTMGTNGAITIPPRAIGMA